MKKFLLLVMIALMMSGCSEEISTIDLPDEYKIVAESERVDVDVYFDATVSMRGFTTLAAGNVYRTLPDLLNDTGNSLGAVKFFSFGESVTALDGRDYRKFSSPEPYSEIITAVHNVIDAADPSRLSIIVTDLFESDADWSNISKKIRDKFFANDLALGIIGIKNSFSGEIFDVGLNAAQFHYDSQNSPRRYRPFYLLIMGRESAVKNFMRKFLERQTLPNETECLLLSKNLSEAPDALTLQTMENFFANDTLNLAEKNLLQFGIDTLREEASLTLQFTYKPTIGALPPNFFDLKPEIKILALDDNWQPLTIDSAEFLVTPIDENIFSVQFKIHPEDFRDGQINFVHAALVPVEGDYLLPEWIGTWNMANVDANPKNFDGSKTANLINIVASLRDLKFAASPPAFVNLNFVVNLQ